MAELKVLETGGELHGEALRERFTAELKESGLSQAKAAKEIGISPGLVNQLLAGKYDHNVEENEAKVNRWIGIRQARREAERTMGLSASFVNTILSQAITGGLIYAHTVRAISLIYGGAGLGKTVTAQHYASSRPNVWIATMTPSTRKPGAMLKRICRSVGVAPQSIWPADVELQLQERLAGTGGLLVVDEANHLTVEALDTLRAIQEAAGIGFALMGNEKIYNQMTGKSRAAHFAQLFSRIAKRVRLDKAIEEDVNALLDAWGAKLHPAARARLFAVAEKGGGYRDMLQTLRTAVLLAAGETVTGSHVADAITELGGDA